MDRKVENLLNILQKIRKSNNFQLAKQFANIPLHLDQLATLKQEISKKDKEWLQNVVESLRLFCLSAYLDKGIVNTSIQDEFTKLIVNDNIKPTADGLIHILEIIWKMHGNKIYKTQLNAARALQAEQSRAQRNEQSANVLKNLGNPNNWNEAPNNIHNKAKIAGPKAFSSTLKQRNSFNTSTIMGNEYVPQIATIHTVKGGRKTHRKRKTLRTRKHKQ